MYTSIISIITITLVIDLFCKHKHIRTIVASLILHKIKEVEANSNPNTEINNYDCGTLAYVGIILTVLSMIIVIFLHYRKNIYFTFQNMACLLQPECNFPPNYLDNGNENKAENEPKITAGVTSPRPPIEEEEPKINDQSTEKCGWGPDCPFCKCQEKKEEQNKMQQQKMSPKKNYNSHRQEDENPELEHDKSQAAMGSRNGEVKFKIQP